VTKEPRILLHPTVAPVDDLSHVVTGLVFEIQIGFAIGLHHELRELGDPDPADFVRFPPEGASADEIAAFEALLIRWALKDIQIDRDDDTITLDDLKAEAVAAVRRDPNAPMIKALPT
jgi:hypothetical protein